MLTQAKTINFIVSTIYVQVTSQTEIRHKFQELNTEWDKQESRVCCHDCSTVNQVCSLLIAVTRYRKVTIVRCTFLFCINCSKRLCHVKLTLKKSRQTCCHQSSVVWFVHANIGSYIYLKKSSYGN